MSMPISSEFVATIARSCAGFQACFHFGAYFARQRTVVRVRERLRCPRR